MKLMADRNTKLIPKTGTAKLELIGFWIDLNFENIFSIGELVQCFLLKSE